VEALSHLLDKILHAKREGSALLHLVNDISEVLGSVSGLTLFVMDARAGYFSQKDHPCYTQQMMMDGKWIERVAKNAKIAQDPCFKKAEELLVKNRLQTRDYLVLPLFDDGILIISCQFRLTESQQLNKTGDARGRAHGLLSDSALTDSSLEEDDLGTPSGDEESKLKPIDDQVLQIIMHFVQLKLDKLATDRDNQLARKEVIDSIKLATMTCTQRSFGDLFQNMR
jgi:hypothetical protein